MIKYNKGVRDFFKNDYPKLYLLSGSQITTKINSKEKKPYWLLLEYFCRNMVNYQ